MFNYKYKAINAQGKSVSGKLQAANESDLEGRLRKMQLDLISFKQQSESTSFLNYRRITRQDLINFCFYLEQQHSAGVPLLESLGDIRDNLDNLRFRAVLSNIIENIENGNTMSQAMANYPKEFSQIFVNLIEAGEQSSRLGEVLRDLISSIKWQDELTAQTKKIIMYPSFIALFVLGVAVFMLTYLVPQMVRFLGNTGNEIPWYTMSLIHTSDFVVNYWYLIGGTPIVVITSVMHAYRKYNSAKVLFDHIILEIPLVGPILKKIILSRFTNYFSLMYGANITILQCLVISERIAGNEYISQALRKIRQQIEHGANLTESFHNSGIFPSLIVRMVRVGETTGALDRSLQNVSYFYNRDVEAGVARLQAMIEPALILFLAGFLCWIAIAVLFPVYNMMGKV